MLEKVYKGNILLLLLLFLVSKHYFIEKHSRRVHETNVITTELGNKELNTKGIFLNCSVIGFLNSRFFYAL